MLRASAYSVFDAVQPITMILFIGLILFVFIVAVLLTRWIFGIPTIIRNLETQTRVLSKIAQKEGIPEEELEMKEVGFFEH